MTHRLSPLLPRDGHTPRVVTIRGPNFSGRTDLLKEFCNGSDNRVYLGPEVYNSLSGLTTTVKQEVELHISMGMAGSAIERAVVALELDKLVNQHPGTLSGGEQACLAVLCGMAVKPHAMAIDCTLEQLDSDRRSTIIGMLRNSAVNAEPTLIVDNLLHEWDLAVASVDVASVRSSTPLPPPVPSIDPGPLASLDSPVAVPINVKGLSVGYGHGPDVLAGLSIELQPGRIYVLEGANGSGKSTWAKVLCGVLRPRKGTIRVGSKEAQLWRRPGSVVGYHFQNPDVQLFESSVLKEVSVGAVRPGHTFPATRRRVECLMSALGLGTVAQENPLSLPFPVRKRVAIAATLACATPWFFLDEPTLGADVTTSGALADIIHILARTGHGVIVVSHSKSFKQRLRGLTLELHGGLLHI